MVLRRTPHADYDAQYHLVWSPKYRKDILKDDVQQRVRELFEAIAQQYDITIEKMEVSSDHVHILCSFPPRYSIAQVYMFSVQPLREKSREESVAVEEPVVSPDRSVRGS